MATLRVPVYEDDIVALVAVIEAAASANQDNLNVDWEQHLGKANRFAAMLRLIYDERKDNNADRT